MQKNKTLNAFQWMGKILRKLRVDSDENIEIIAILQVSFNEQKLIKFIP